MSFTREIELALTAARAAADRVRALYASGVEVAWKGHDDPVTTADREANAMIVAALRGAFPDDGICAEESDAGEAAEAAARGGRCWFIDPLDGTKDFVQRNGEFCVMVGLAVQGRAALGVVVSPVSGVALVGVPGEGAWSIDPSGARTELAVRPVTPVTSARMIGSRSHPHPRVTALAAALGVTDMRVRGSVGLKVAAVATGECDLYAHFGRGPKLWDGCAPEAIARGAGAVVTDSLGRDIVYDTSHLGLDDGLVVAPPWLHAVTLAELARLAAQT